MLLTSVEVHVVLNSSFSKYKAEQIQQTAQIHVVWQKLPRLLKYCPLSPALHICVQENQQQKVARLYNFHHIFNCMYSDISKNSRSRNISHMLDRILGRRNKFELCNVAHMFHSMCALISAKFSFRKGISTAGS